MFWIYLLQLSLIRLCQSCTEREKYMFSTPCLSFWRFCNLTESQISNVSILNLNAQSSSYVHFSLSFFFNIWIINRVTWYGWWKKCVIKCSTKSKKAFAWTAGREKEKSCWVTSSCSIHIWFRHSQFCFVHWWMVLKQEAIEESVGHKWHICIICIAW